MTEDGRQPDSPSSGSKGSGAVNVGRGTRISINDLVQWLEAPSDIPPALAHGQPRPGDTRDNLADIAGARSAFAFSSGTNLEVEGHG